ncbi:hypothetical protein KI387_017223, partial [Taxus chinensis]
DSSAETLKLIELKTLAVHIMRVIYTQFEERFDDSLQYAAKPVTITYTHYTRLIDSLVYQRRMCGPSTGCYWRDRSPVNGREFSRQPTDLAFVLFSERPKFPRGWYVSEMEKDDDDVKTSYPAPIESRQVYRPPKNIFATWTLHVVLANGESTCVLGAGNKLYQVDSARTLHEVRF